MKDIQHVLGTLKLEKLLKLKTIKQYMAKC